MQQCHVVEIVTPKKFVLNGLWFGPRKAKKAIVWVHGLTSSVFSMQSAVQALVSKETAVLTFNNRGFGTINSVKRKVGRKSKSILAGAAHETFTDCVDDIQGAINLARKQGAKKIYLVGHSTGCQKAVYWASRTKGRGVKGIILLAPVSDYADILRRVKPERLRQLVALARSLVRRGKKHELLPKPAAFFSWGPFLCDAQRFLSLYSPDSKETIFSYEQPRKRPRVLESVRVPVLVLWAEKDEYADRPAREIASWFERHIRNREVLVVSRMSHGFKGGERTIARIVRRWIQ